MADPILVNQDGALVTDGGRVVLGRCGKCCGQCAFYKYLPCVADPHPDCPYPPPAYVTTCWRCTTSGTSDVIQDDLGYCWGRDGDQKYLPRDGATGDPPEGYEWIPDGAVVWSDTEGPCMTDCGASACRSFDRFIPARRCACSTVGPEVAYFRCADVADLTGCVVARHSSGGCYELDRQAQSVPGPIHPSLILNVGATPYKSCCSCCAVDRLQCRTGLLGLEQRDGCPLTPPRRSAVEVCCETGKATQIGYIYALEHLGLGCPPNVYEHWWHLTETGGTLWRRWRQHDGGAGCTFTLYEDSIPRSPIACDTELVWHFTDISSPQPSGFGFSCTGECDDFFYLRESPSGGRFAARAYLPPVGTGCELRHEVAAAVVRYATGGICGGNCNKLGPADPVVPDPPSGGDGPEALGFSVGYVTDRTTGVARATIRHPALPRIIAPVPSVTLSRNTRPRGCANCGKDGGL